MISLPIFLWFCYEMSYVFHEVQVCNRVGGIYTVIRSKAPATIEEFAQHYVCLGPYIPANAAPEFEEVDPPNNIAEAMKGIKEKQGIVGER